MPLPEPIHASGRWSTPVGWLRLEGRDTRTFLHGQSSQAIALSQPGSCLATCLISPTARMRALALVLVDDTGADLVVLAGDAQAVHQGLDRVLFPADQVRLGPVQTAQLVRWLGPGPQVSDVATSGRWLQPEVCLGAGAGRAALLLPQEAALPDALAALPELPATVVEQLRLRQGFPAAPGEINDSTNPFELGLAGWVSLNKGCYVGQETLAKLATYDGVKQQLRWWRAQPSSPAAADACKPGASLTTSAGERAGVISSALATADGVEGLALVRRSALAEAALQLEGAGTAAAIQLTIAPPLGFVAPPVGAGGQG